MKLTKILLLLLLSAALASCTGASTDETTNTGDDDVINVESQSAPDTSIETVSDVDPTAICEANTPAEDAPTTTFPQAEQVIEDGVDYVAVFCTSAGAIAVDLYEDETPITINNFVFLATSDYYNNQIFHRVIENFMAQGGDPTGTGRGGPGYQFTDEFVQGLEFDEPYLLAMANAGPGTNGSQFFITFVETPHLNGRHTIFGEVIQGQQAVDSIQLRDPRFADAPATDLQTIVIVEREG